VATETDEESDFSNEDDEELASSDDDEFASVQFVFDQILEAEYCESSRAGVQQHPSEFGPFPNISSALICLFLRMTHLSRSHFESLLKLLRHPNFRPTDIPSSYSTAQRYLSALPRMPIYMRNLTHYSTPAQVTNRVTAYYHHPTDIVQHVLRTRALRESMHFGYAIKTEKKSELWHGELWAESPLFGPGNLTIFEDQYSVGDFIYYQPEQSKNLSIGRICQIWQVDDESQSADLIIGVQRIVWLKDLSKELQQQLDPMVHHNSILEEEPVFIELHCITGKANFFFIESNEEPSASSDHAITDIIYTHPSSGLKRIRSCRLRRIHPSEIYSSTIPPRPMRTLRLFLIIFFDEMGAFRHTYHCLGGCYLIIGNIPSRLRRYLRNVFLLGFVPFGCTFEEFILPIVNDLKRLQQGEVWLIDGEEYFVVAGKY